MDALEQDEASDDWLTVNVWSPVPEPGAGLPVMVWIQGGGYVIGMSGLPEYDGGRLARDGGVVVVTFNYRVGIEGFAQIEGAPANRGLLDQVAALEWVRDNIQAFGGDPDRVTVFGQSAGGGSVAALLAMDRAAGLFRRAIVQSMPGTYFTPELAADITAACAATLGRRPTVAGLSECHPTPAFRGRRCRRCHDGAVGAPLGVARAAGDRRSRPWSTARCCPSRRGRPWLTAPPVTSSCLSVTPATNSACSAPSPVCWVRWARSRRRRLCRLFAPGPDGARRYRDAFPSAGPEALYELVHSDWLFRMPSLHLADAQAAAGGRVHVYELTWPAPGMGGIFGACHGLDVPLVFGNLDRGQPAMLIGDASLFGGGGRVRPDARRVDIVRPGRRPRLAGIRHR